MDTMKSALKGEWSGKGWTMIRISALSLSYFFPILWTSTICGHTDGYVLIDGKLFIERCISENFKTKLPIYWWNKCTFALKHWRNKTMFENLNKSVSPAFPPDVLIIGLLFTWMFINNYRFLCQLNSSNINAAMILNLPSKTRFPCQRYVIYTFSFKYFTLHAASIKRQLQA